MRGLVHSLVFIALSVSCSGGPLLADNKPRDRRASDDAASKTESKDDSAADEEFDKKLEKLLRDLKSPATAERIRAAQAIGALGRDAERVTGELCAALVDRTPSVRQAASEALEKVNPEFREMVFPIAADGSRHNRIEFLKKLSESGDENRAAVPVVIYRLEVAATEGGAAWAETEAGLRTLAAIGIGDKTSQEEMIRLATKAPTERARGQALGYLSQMDIKDTKRVVAVLTTAMRMDSDRNKAAAIRGLADYGRHAKSAIDTLRKAKGNRSAAVRDAAAEALTKIESDIAANANKPGE